MSDLTRPALLALLDAAEARRDWPLAGLCWRAAWGLVPWRIYAALPREQWRELERLTQRQAAQRLADRCLGSHSDDTPTAQSPLTTRRP